MNDTINDAVKLYHDGAWIPLMAVVVGVILRVCKDDKFVAWFPYTIPPRARAAVALGLGLILGVLEAVVSGQSWVVAVLGGLGAAMTAITSHDVVINGIRDGRDIGSPKRVTAAEPPPAA